MISVGIDVSKGKSTVCILKPCGEVLAPPFDVLHNIESMSLLISRIKSYDEDVRIILENTGHYHWPIVTLFVENKIFVTCVNALCMKKFCSQGIRKAKTDKIDSYKIAQYGITFWNELTPILPSDDTYEQLRMLSRQYYQYISLLTKAKINFSNILDRVMPDINSILSDENDKLSDFVQRYWHFANVHNKSEKSFTDDYCKWAKKKGYRRNESKAHEIYALAANSIPTLPYNNLTKTLVREAIRVIRELVKSRDTILSHMKEIASLLPEYSILISMYGIGDILASRFLAEAGDIRRFHSKGALIAYTGIDAPPYQSGTFTATDRNISKRGNKYLRRTGCEIMHSFIKHKPTEDCAVYDYMLRKKAEGKAFKHYCIAGLNKFLRIYYARVRDLYRDMNGQFTSQ